MPGVVHLRRRNPARHSLRLTVGVAKLLDTKYHLGRHRDWGHCIPWLPKVRSICPSTLLKVIILGSVRTAIMVGEAATLKAMTVVQVVLQQAADDYGERVNPETTFR
ncbi:hypothetical protein PHYSODRAFT_343380 [Phytophthora sojae]|uniref:Uncharacterized protein n=1 Tax=Phytophthora sojae (strain P6497) TaxID=1094619 RepID=G4ZVA7_PHYSP|nr:hypothetical protein PHYSODRAFT_335470 [Phytophthora sojae]XP_009531163.1 hypothetical protein PHYSODRAFT_335473 [Phytophthora sojae]XP_009540229.1 hypothetical protein PHYSODRAFT_343380 [Phytophthora sojae]EGZ04324.1 hypothetical protein PHYSODRAFT_343380 [Phytophthora sojae]EGZ13731.1 hypothetical protein PHYSODRAFT_335470 [Phytophthora sojae]EGZ13734.1 hypothetical protein PHYSODRAFT_335473 [Phytophthora sojae]|eukprot:XP_009531160.1 hypothetical protein PHYSODRAFT_335470 [Phytophthora sojae]